MSPLAKVYIASRLENAAAVRELRDELAKHDVALTYDWTAHGSVQGEGIIAHDRAEAVEEADLLIVLLPGSADTQVELGVAIGSGVDILLVGEHERGSVFYSHDACFQVPSDSAATIAGHVEHMLNLEDIRAEHARMKAQRATTAAPAETGRTAEPARAPRGHAWPSVT